MRKTDVSVRVQKWDNTRNREKSIDLVEQHLSLKIVRVRRNDISTEGYVLISKSV